MRSRLESRQRWERTEKRLKTLADCPPSGCHHCGIGERHHARQWTDAAGWHGFTEPSRELIVERMRAKYADRIEAKGGAA